MTSEAILSILDFLLRGSVPYDKVGYTADRLRFKAYRLVIVDSGFFAHPPTTVPQVNEWITNAVTDHEGHKHNLPVLFGNSDVERLGDTIVVHSDVIATAWFFLTRFEETLTNDRDRHGRFLAKHSIALRYGFLDRPILDEYGEWLRGLLGVNNSPHHLGAIYLTHDIDRVTLYRNLQGTLGAIKRTLLGHNEFPALFRALSQNAEADPLFTFEDMIHLDALLPNATVIYFLKSAAFNHSLYDKPLYHLGDKDSLRMLSKICATNAHLGWHSSYHAATSRDRLYRDMKDLVQQMGHHNIKIKDDMVPHRSHYLRSPAPQHFTWLAQIGIRHDFTLAYPDCIGFRSGTCHPYPWIDPITGQVTTLTIHPLTLMDVTLSDEQYMHLKQDEAYQQATRIINTVAWHGGELTMLWHNNSFRTDITDNYHPTLYRELIDFLGIKSHEQ